MARKKDEKLPYMKYFPADFSAEPTLRLCSWEARYLWVELFGFMHHAPQRGYLLKQNGDPYSEADLVASIFGANPQKIRDCLFELETNAVFSRDRRGIIYCRRMVKGEKRAKNLSQKDEKEKKRYTKSEDKVKIAPSGTIGNIKQISGSGDRSVVKPESRSQNLDKKRKNTKKEIPKPEGVKTDIWEDFIIHRKAKKSPVTKTAIDGIKSEATTAGITLEQALSEICQRGWIGFKAEWIKQRKENYHEPAKSRSQRADEALQRALDSLETRSDEAVDDAVGQIGSAKL